MTTRTFAPGDRIKVHMPDSPTFHGKTGTVAPDDEEFPVADQGYDVWVHMDGPGLIQAGPYGFGFDELRSAS